MRIMSGTISVCMFLTSWVWMIRFAFAHWAVLSSGIRWEIVGVVGMLPVPLLASARDKTLGSFSLAMAYLALQFAVVLAMDLLKNH